jgi:predicted RNA binding protein YcfA (HicA-like mRNA interferase family)
LCQKNFHTGFSRVGNAKKALEKILDRQRAANVTFAEMEAALGVSGFVCRPGKGSHRVWCHADGRMQVLSAHGATPPSYLVRQVRELLSR